MVFENNLPDTSNLAATFATQLPDSSTVDPDDPDALKAWFTRCADVLMPYFEPTEDHRGWLTDPDLKVAVTRDTREWWEPVVEDRTVMETHLSSDSLKKTEEVVVDRVRHGEVVGFYLDVQADTLLEQRAITALSHACDIRMDEYQGSYTRFTHRLEHANYNPALDS